MLLVAGAHPHQARFSVIARPHVGVLGVQGMGTRSFCGVFLLSEEGGRREEGGGGGRRDRREERGGRQGGEWEKREAPRRREVREERMKGNELKPQVPAAGLPEGWALPNFAGRLQARWVKVSAC